MGVLDKKTDIGKFRECNEDAVALLCHPKNKNIILLAVADGDNRKANGSIASNYILRSLLDWFENLDDSYNYMHYITLENGITTVDKVREDMFTKNTTNFRE